MNNFKNCLVVNSIKEKEGLLNDLTKAGLTLTNVMQGTMYNKIALEFTIPETQLLSLSEVLSKSEHLGSATTPNGKSINWEYTSDFHRDSAYVSNYVNKEDLTYLNSEGVVDYVTVTIWGTEDWNLKREELINALSIVNDEFNSDDCICDEFDSIVIMDKKNNIATNKYTIQCGQFLNVFVRNDLLPQFHKVMKMICTTLNTEYQCFYQFDKYDDEHSLNRVNYPSGEIEMF